MYTTDNYKRDLASAWRSAKYRLLAGILSLVRVGTLGRSRQTEFKNWIVGFIYLIWFLAQVIYFSARLVLRI
jgi:hypothetical protein